MIKQNYRILIVEDHDFVLKSAYEEFISNPDYDLDVFVASSFSEGKQMILKQDYDVVFLDYILKDDREFETKYGDELIHFIRQKSNETKIIMLSKLDTFHILEYFIHKLNVDGYIFKSRKSLSELIPALEIVLDGDCYLSPRVEKSLKYGLSILDIDSIGKQLLVYIYRGVLVRHMPTQLEKDGFSPITVSAIEKRLKGLREKFEVSTNGALVVRAMKLGIIE